MQDISTWSTGYNTINNTHYTCWNTTGICNKISFVNYISSPSVYYTEITGGKGIIEAIDEMLHSDDVNRYNSLMKGIIDNWYAK